MIKLKESTWLLILSFTAIILALAFVDYVEVLYNQVDKYDTQSLIDNKEILNVEQMDELTRKTVIVCSTNKNLESYGAMQTEKSGNIYTFTYDTTAQAEAANEKLSHRDDVIYSQLDNALSTNTLTKEEMEFFGVDCKDCENGDCDIHIIVRETVTIKPEDIHWITDGVSEMASTNDGEVLMSVGATFNEDIAEAIMENLESNSIKDTDRKAVIVVIDSGANGNFEHSFNAFDGSSNVTDTHGHGTAMVNIIKSNLVGYNYEIVPIKIANENGVASVSALVRALEYASELNPTVVNISLTSLNNTQDEILNSYLGKLAENQVVTCVSAGNNSDDAGNYVPSKFVQAIVFGSCDENGNRKPFSNYGSSVDFNIVSNSTSEASAIASSLYAKAYLEELYFTEIAEESKLVFDTYGDYLTNIWNTKPNNTDEIEYNANSAAPYWWASNGTSGKTDINGGSTGLYITKVTFQAASGKTDNKNAVVKGTTCNGTCTDANREVWHPDTNILGVWMDSSYQDKYAYGSGGTLKVSATLGGTSIGDKDVTTVTTPDYIGGPCSGAGASNYGGFKANFQSLTWTFSGSSSSNQIPANTTKTAGILVKGGTGTYNSPAIIGVFKWNSWSFETGNLHTHNYNQTGNLRSAATCTAAATYWYKCSCGGTNGTYFSSGSALGHSYTGAYQYANATGYYNGGSTTISSGLKYRNCNRSGCSVRLENYWLHQTRVYYETATGGWDGPHYWVNGYTGSGQSISGWSRAADATYKVVNNSGNYTTSNYPVVKDIYVYRQTYNQTVQVRYENADGTFTAYSNVINTAYRQGATVSWSRAADTTYKAASISYTVDGTATKQVTVYRQTYQQTIKYRYENADGTFGSYTTYLDKAYRYGESISWSVAKTDAHEAKSLSYTVTGANTYNIDIMRNHVTFNLNGYIQGTSQEALTKDGLTFGTADVYINGVSVANDVSDYNSSTINYGSSVEIKDVKAKSGYTYGGVYNNEALSFTITTTKSIALIFDDKTAPVISVSSSHSTWTNQNVTLTFSATDASGVFKMQLIRNGNVLKEVTNGNSTTYTISTDDNGNYEVKAVDRYGNTSSATKLVQRDTVKPTITLDKHSGYWADNHIVKVTVADNASGVKDSGHFFSESSSASSTYSSKGSTTTYNVEIATDGNWYLYIKVTDNAGNSATLRSTGTFDIDRTKPDDITIGIVYNGDHVVVTGTSQDRGSGISGWAITTSQANPTTWETTGFTAGTDKVSWSKRIDNAGTYWIYTRDLKGNISNPTKFVLTTYTINYINNYGGNTNTYKTLNKIFVNSTWTTEAAPTNTTYTFKGWNTNNLGTGTNLKEKTAYTFNEDFIKNTLKFSMTAGTNNTIKIYGWWEKAYSLTLNLNGGTFNGSKNNLVLTGKFYNNVTSYTFNIVGGLTPSSANYYDKQVNSFNTYGTLGINGTNKDIIKKSLDGTTYRLIGWSTNKNAKVPDSGLITYDNNHKTTYTISANTTLYAVWEPVLYVQAIGNRNLGIIHNKDVESITQVTTQGSTVISGQPYNGFITTVARPGENIKYNLQFRGHLDYIQVKFDPYITNMYDFKNPVYSDLLNKVDIESIDEAIPSTGYTEVNSNLNRIINNPLQSVTRQFYLPQYLGTELAKEASHQSKTYYVDYIFTNADSFYYDYVFGKDEVVTIRQYLVLADSDSSSGDDPNSVLNDLRTKLKIRFR